MTAVALPGVVCADQSHGGHPEALMAQAGTEPVEKERRNYKRSRFSSLRRETVLEAEQFNVTRTQDDNFRTYGR